MSRSRVFATLPFLLALWALIPPSAGAQSTTGGAAGSGSGAGSSFYRLVTPGAEDETAVPGFVLTTGESPSVSRSNSTDQLLRTLTGADYYVRRGDLFELTLVTYDRSGAAASPLVLDLIIDEDNTLMLPFAGPIGARGLTLGELRKTAFAAIRAKESVLHVDLRLTAPAAFQVFVAGAVETAGYVSVNGLMRASDAVDSAGGTIDGASLRRIRLHRAGQEHVVDLLRFATGHEPEANPLLEAGDAIYVPVTQTGVEVRGEVRYEGLYELVAGETLGDLVELAGGLTAAADRRKLSVARMAAAGGYSISLIDIDAAPDTEVIDGDIVEVRSMARNSPMVVVQGAVFGSATDGMTPQVVPTADVLVQVPYSTGATLLRVLEQLGGPTPFADTKRSFVLRARTGERVEVDVGTLWKGRDPSADVPIEPGDQIVIPRLTLNVALQGEAMRAGLQPYVPGYSVADYLWVVGGINPISGTTSRMKAVSQDGTRFRIGLDYQPVPGDTIIIAKNGSYAFSTFFTQYVFPVTGVVSTLVAVVYAGVELFNYLVASFPAKSPTVK